MVSLSYLPFVIFLIDVLGYIWCSVRLRRIMSLSITTWALLAVEIVVYSRANGIINISDNFVWISFVVMIAIGASLADQYKTYL